MCIDDLINLLVLVSYERFVISKEVIYSFTHSIISMHSLGEDAFYLELLSDV